MKIVNGTNVFVLLVSVLMLSTPALAKDNEEHKDDDHSASKSLVKGLKKEIADRIAADAALLDKINSIELIPGPQGPKGDTGLTGATGLQGPAGAPGANGKSCTAIQGAGSATIICEDGTAASVYDGSNGAPGNLPGDMQYWNGTQWVVVPAPGHDATSLSFCGGKPVWTTGGCTYAIGDTGPAGGTVFYIVPGSNGKHGLEASPVDQSTGATWGCTGTEILNAFGTAIGTGAQNTAAIVAGCAETGIAARAANDFVLNGYTDWYLPSRDELDQLYLERAMVSGLSTISVYWSSSQTSSIGTVQTNGANAIGLNFLDGSQLSPRKSNAYLVRAIRSF